MFLTILTLLVFMVFLMFLMLLMFLMFLMFLLFLEILNFFLSWTLVLVASGRYNHFVGFILLIIFIG